LITDYSAIVDVDACRTNKTAEVRAMRKMIDRTQERFGLKPDWIAADTAYGAADNLVWLTLKRQIPLSSQSLTKGNARTGPTRDPTSHAMMRPIVISARKGRKCCTHGAPILILRGMYRVGKRENTEP